MPTPSESRPIWPDSCRSQHLSHRDQKQVATRPTEKCREARDYKITMILLRARRRWDRRTKIVSFGISDFALFSSANTVSTCAQSRLPLTPTFPPCCPSSLILDLCRQFRDTTSRLESSGGGGRRDRMIPMSKYQRRRPLRIQPAQYASLGLDAGLKLSYFLSRKSAAAGSQEWPLNSKLGYRANGTLPSR